MACTSSPAASQVRLCAVQHLASEQQFTALGQRQLTASAGAPQLSRNNVMAAIILHPLLVSPMRQANHADCSAVSLC
jgi:hypothetical protein